MQDAIGEAITNVREAMCACLRCDVPCTKPTNEPMCYSCFTREHNRFPSKCEG